VAACGTARSLAAGGRAAVLALSLATLVAGCDGEASEEEATLVHGTTEQPLTYDPAGAWDLPSWTVIYNAYQFLLQIPPGGTVPEPDAARACEFTGQTTYRCELRAGLRFSDGSRLTAEDAAFSFERVLRIGDPDGPAPLFANLEEVRAPDERTVVFELREPDATWPYRLATGGAAIVPSDSYQPDKLQPNEEVIGSGRYLVEAFDPGRETLLEANPRFTGEDPASIDRITIRYYETSESLRLALLEGEVDLAYRTLSPPDVAALRAEADQGVSVVADAGSEIRFLAFNLELQAGKDEGQRLAVRRAAAYLIDRQAISKDVYDGTVEPLFSMVPRGVEFATEAFAEEYGRAPDPEAARRELEEAGLEPPVELDLWWSTSQFGPATGEEFAELERQLEAEELFAVDLHAEEGERFERDALADDYPEFGFGWFPHFPDADNFTAPFYARTTFLDNHFSNERLDGLLAEQRSTTEQSERAEALEEIQRIGAELAPTIPLWQAKQVAGVGEGVSGVEETFDPSYQLRYWLLDKGG
jgi:peptide/nickel transport system substrate-binding protein